MVRVDVIFTPRYHPSITPKGMETTGRILVSFGLEATQNMGCGDAGVGCCVVVRGEFV
jgi:hypothetical protein